MNNDIESTRKRATYAQWAGEELGRMYKAAGVKRLHLYPMVSSPLSFRRIAERHFLASVLEEPPRPYGWTLREWDAHLRTAALEAGYELVILNPETNEPMEVLEGRT